METIWIVIVVYIIVIIGLSVLLNRFSSHKKRFAVIFTYDMDYVFYEIAKEVTAAKNTLYNYEDTIAVIYHDKTKIFSKPILTYQQQFDKIRENMDYVENLLKKEIFTQKFKQRLTENYRTLKRISRIQETTHTILTFLTLGIAKIRTS